MGTGEAAISRDASCEHRAHCAITVLTPQWDTHSVLRPNCPIRDFNILFCFDLISEDRMLAMMARAPGPWCLETPLILPSSPFLLSFWQATGHPRLPQKGKEVLSGDKNGRYQDGGLSGCRYSKVWGQYATWF